MTPPSPTSVWAPTSIHRLLSHTLLGSCSAAPPDGLTRNVSVSLGLVGLPGSLAHVLPASATRHRPPPSLGAVRTTFPRVHSGGTLARQRPRAARRSIACSGSRRLARGQDRGPGMSFRAVPLGRAGLCQDGPGQGRSREERRLSWRCRRQALGAARASLRSSPHPGRAGSPVSHWGGGRGCSGARAGR